MIRLQKHDPELEKFYWVALAKTKDQARYNLDCIQIKDGLAVATDGHRLHIAVLEGDYPEGCFEVVTHKKSEVVLAPPAHGEPDFPDWHKVFPPTDGSFNLTINRLRPWIAYTKLVRMLDEKNTVNYKYFEQLSDATWECYLNGPHSAILFVTPYKMAIIMPMRIN